MPLATMACSNSRASANTKPEYLRRSVKLQINGVGRETPVADAATLIEMAWDLPGRRARDFCRACADGVRRVMGGDVSLVDEIERRHADIAGTEEERFLLGSNSENKTQVVDRSEPTPMMIYNLELLKAEAANKQLTLREKELAMEEENFKLEMPSKKLKIVQDWKKALEDVSAFTVTDRVHYQAAIRNTIPSDHVPMIEDGHQRNIKEYTLSEYLQLEKGRVVNFKLLMEPGKVLAAMYRQITGREPGTKLVEVNGRATHVKAYTNERIQGAPDGITGFDLMD